MITPSFGLTATERVLPRLALDFTTASLDPRITFTRTGATATKVNSSGLIETVSADTPRFDYTLNTGGDCLGLLIEESRQNLVNYSNAMNSWSNNSGETSVTTDAYTAPDGTMTADLITTVSGSFRLVANAVSITSGVSYTMSAYVYPVNTTTMRFFHPVLGSVVFSNLTQNVWQRVSATGVASSTYTGAVQIRGTEAGQEYCIWGVQVEAGAFPTSIIFTSGSPVTRNADVATMTGTNFSDWFNATEGTFAINATLKGVPGYTTFFANLNSNSTTNYITIGHGGAGSVPYFRVLNNNVDQSLINLGSTIGTGQNQFVGSYKANNFDAARNGVAGSPDTSGTIPSGIDRMIFFNRNGAARPMSGWIQNFYYWPQQFTAAECAAFSKQ